MGYNATYGFQNFDSQSTFELKPEKGHENEISFLCTDELGQIMVKPEMRVCDVCGASIGNGIGFVHGSYMYCEKCEEIHRKNERVNKLKKRINNKKRQVKK